MNGSIVEAAVDDFAVVSLNCFEPCAAADGDLNLDGAADGQDVRWLVDGILNGAAQPALCAGDFSANGALDLADVAGFVDTLIGP